MKHFWGFFEGGKTIILTERNYRDISQALHSRPDRARINELLQKAQSLAGLSPAEAGELLNIKEEEALHNVFETAGRVKEKIYGPRIVLFAPLYLSNECSNNCPYCGFRKDNRKITRVTLTPSAAVAQAARIEGMGHKRILLVCGENQAGCSAGNVAEIIRNIYERTGIRRINVNMAPLPVEGFRELKQAGIGTYQIFQETYHPAAYTVYHRTGAKANYGWRLTAPDRAMQAGIDDVGIGALFGLYDYRFEVMALILHAGIMEKRWGVGPHTVSVPRLKRAPGSLLPQAPYPVSDIQLMLITAVLRLALPYTGIILSTREPAVLRDRLLKIGVSQISAGSSTAPGGYGSGERGGCQFNLEDNRTLDEVVRDICKAGYLPSFCTACYRRERTGQRFMALAKGGQIKKLCQPNALLTFREYLLDYAAPETRATGESLVKHFLECDDVKSMQPELAAGMAKIEAGQRDVCF